MTQKDKELLLKDLCARLPYGVKIKHITQRADACQAEVSFTERLGVYTLKVMMEFKKEDFSFFLNKPYLFPLSSMTDEQRKEYNSIIYKEIELHADRYYDVIEVISFEKLQDFYHENHLDYRGLIPKGLALDATGLNIY